MIDDNKDGQSPGRLGESSIGDQIKYWRNRAHISQLDLSMECDTSSRHLSFIETGRAHPSRKLLLQLINHLEVPLRSRNALLISAGYAPVYEETGLSAPEMEQVRSMLNIMVRHHGFFPSMLIDRHWNILESNLAFDRMCRTFVEDASLLDAPPLNLMRCFLNPQCLGSAVANYGEMHRAMLNRLRRSINVTSGDLENAALLKEILAYQTPESQKLVDDIPQLVMPLRLKKGDRELSLFTMVATIGAPLNITLQEIQLEFGLPMDQASENFLKDIVDNPDD